MFKKVDLKQNFPKLEEKILNFWRKEKIFERSVKERPKKKSFSFYDGPPFATGLPHYGHLLAGTIKDVIPRYKTMQGFRVERVWGWDTHGLPIENIVEQEFNFKNKLQIEAYGIDKFNDRCRIKVLKYAKEWEKIVERTGRWVDMGNAYLTMDIDYMESVWWVFKTLWDKKLIYEGHKVMPYCPRCSTSLSNFEVGLGYLDKRDKAITVRFKLENEPDTYLLAWTTTPWTLPGNLALAIGPKIDYIKVKKGKESYILAKSAFENYINEVGDKIVEQFKGKKMVGQKYKPTFNYYKNPKKAFEIISGSFVAIDEGTGIVHIAPAFGEEDYQVAKENNIDFYMPVDDLGKFEIDVSDYAGKSVIALETNQQIIDDLSKRGLVIKEEEIVHAYPHCWRCDTPLIYRAVSSYFVKVQKIKKRLLDLNKKIYWMPDFVGQGRFHKILEAAPDWNISRNRFWGTPLPVWRCDQCQEVQVFGSVAELEKESHQKINDLHLHKLQSISLKCECGGSTKLSGEVLDCWFESGSMPYASIHYPFKNKERFRHDFPADFIAEGIDQTRGWFNSLLILSCALFDRPSFKNVIVNGIVLAENGQKMSKRLENYPDPVDIINRYGADAMRFYLMNSPAVKADDFRFSEKGVDEILKKMILTIWNAYNFFVTYANLEKFTPKEKLNSKNILDQWVISKISSLKKEVTQSFDNFDLSEATQKLADFVEELSNWYIRRSRKRFWGNPDKGDKIAAYETLYFVLMEYIKLLSPFMPFIAEEIYQNLTLSVNNNEAISVHLTKWPKINEKLIDKKLIREMEKLRELISHGLAIRSEKGIKVRQPLSKATYGGQKLKPEFESLLGEELNVKKVIFDSKIKDLKLDTKITPELKEEGWVREIIRNIQNLRKKADLTINDIVTIYYHTPELKDLFLRYQAEIKNKTITSEILPQKKDLKFSIEFLVDGKKIWLGLETK